MSIPNHFR